MITSMRPVLLKQSFKHDLFKRSSLTQVLLLVGSLLLSACSQDMTDLHTFIEQTKSSHVGSVKPIPQFKPYESFTYSAANLRDPFVADINLEQKQKTANALHPNSGRPREILENFPLDSLSMVGTLQQKDQRWALIKDPQNVVHNVQVGNYLGQNEGRITNINDTSVSLVEIIPDGIGGYIERDASIGMGDKDEK